MLLLNILPKKQGPAVRHKKIGEDFYNPRPIGVQDLRPCFQSDMLNFRQFIAKKFNVKLIKRIFDLNLAKCPDFTNNPHPAGGNSWNFLV